MSEKIEIDANEIVRLFKYYEAKSSNNTGELAQVVANGSLGVILNEDDVNECFTVVMNKDTDTLTIKKIHLEG